MSESIYRCPVCNDRHSLDDREAKGGQRVCPECGHNRAFVEDTGENPP